MIRILKYTLIILSLVSFSTLAGDRLESETTADNKVLDFFHNLNGQLQLMGIEHFHHSQQGDKKGWGFADLELEFSGSISENINYTAKPRLRYDTINFSSGTIKDVNETDTERYILNLDEGFIQYASDIIELKLGKMIYVWGVADGHNPSNNLNPNDVLDIPTIEPIGIPSISLAYTHTMFDIEFVYVPVFTPSRLSKSDNRWIGDLSDAQTNFGTLNLVLGDRELPSQTWDNSQFAIRLTSSSIIDGWDFALTYYDGIESIGVLRGKLVGFNVVLDQVYPRFREIGGSFSTTIGQFEIHGEAGAHFTDGNEKDDDYYEYVAGINYTWYPNFELIEEILFVVEYAGEDIFDEKPFGNEFSGSGEYIRPFKDSILTNTSIKFSEETKLSIAFIKNLGDDDFLFRPNLSHKFTDALEFELGFDIIQGNTTTFLGKWTKNDRVWITSTYRF